MAYKKVGIVAVMDVTGFLPNVTKFLSSIQKMNQTVTESTATMTKMQAPVTAIGKSFGTLALAAGAILASNMFKQISDGLADLASRAEKAAETFQLLEVRFTTLAARDYMREQGGAVSMTEALEATTGAAKANLEWLRKLAVTTPYTVQSLSDMAAYAQSAGFTSSQVKELAQTVGDFAAGMGLTSEHVDRIIWNFAQMKSAGRVLGRELRDLGNSMIPVDYIIEKLATEFNVTKEEMKSMLQTGQVSADKFIATFNEMSATEFEGAMARMSNTLSFAKENLKDFIDTMLGLDILKPTADVIGQMLNNMLQVLMSKQARQATVSFGFALRESFLTVADAVKGQLLPSIKEFNSVIGVTSPTVIGVAEKIMNFGYAINFVVTIFSKAVKFISRFVNSIATVVSDNFGNMAKRSENWGANLVIQFANGMARAIGAILDVLTYIASVIAAWLQPGSPPKILPDIDDWGEAAMNEYLQGWKEADFSVFDDISGMLEKYVKAFADLETGDAISRILGGRSAAAEVIDQWGSVADVPVDEINKITAAVGISNETMTNYISSLFTLRSVTEDTAEAEGILAYELGGTTTVLGMIVDSLDEAKAAAAAYQGAASAEVRAYIEALSDMSIAQAAADRAQQELNDTTAYYDTILAELYRQQNKLSDDLENSQRLKVIDKTLTSVILTADERERLELEKRGILLKREIRDTEDSRDTAVEAARSRVDAAEEAVQAAKDAAEVQKKLASEIAQATQDQVEAQVASYQKLLEAMIKNRELMNETLEKTKLGGTIDDLISEETFGEGTVEDIEDLSAGIEDAIKALSDNLRAKWENLLKGVTDPFKPLEEQLNTFRLALDTAAKAIKEHPIAAAVSGLVAGILAATAVGALKGIGGIILSKLSAPALAAALVPVVTKAGTIVAAALPVAVIGALSLSLALAVAVLIGAIRKFGPDAWGAVQSIAGIISYHWNNDVIPKWKEMFGGIVPAIKEGIENSKAINSAKDAVSNVIGSLFGKEGEKPKWLKNAEKFGDDFIQDAIGPDGWLTRFSHNAENTWDNTRTSIFGEGGKAPKWLENAKAFGNDVVQDAIGPEGWLTRFSHNAENTWDNTRISIFGEGGKAPKWLENAKAFGNDVVQDAIGPEGWLTRFSHNVDNTWDNITTSIFGTDGKAPKWLEKCIAWGNNIIEDSFGEEGWATDFIKDMEKMWDDTIATVFGEDGKAPEWLTKLNAWFTDILDDAFGPDSFLTDWKADVAKWWEDTKESIFGENGWATKLIPDFVKFGADIIGGIIQGFGENVGRLWTAIVDLVKKALGIAKDKSDSHSPSGEWAKESRNWILGLVQGVEDNSYLIENAVKSLVGEALTKTAKVTLEMMGLSDLSGAFAKSYAAQNVTNTSNQYINVEVNPSYQNVQSPASIYYDVSSALAAVRR